MYHHLPLKEKLLEVATDGDRHWLFLHQNGTDLLNRGSRTQVLNLKRVIARTHLGKQERLERHKQHNNQKRASQRELRADQARARPDQAIGTHAIHHTILAHAFTGALDAAQSFIQRSINRHLAAYQLGPHRMDGKLPLKCGENVANHSK